jgi:hypothetical protein
MPKPGGDPSSGTSLGDVLRLLAKLNQALVRNVRTWPAMLKGKGTSGSNREAESTDAPERGGLPRSSGEAGVMPVERRGQVIAVGLGPPATGGT